MKDNDVVYIGGKGNEFNPKGYSHSADVSDWEADLHDIRPKDWQRLEYPEHNPLLESEDEVLVFRFNTNVLVHIERQDRDYLAIQRRPEVLPSVIMDPYEGGPYERRSLERRSDPYPVTIMSGPVGSRPDPIAAFQRICWLVLSCISLVWGGLSGAAFSVDSFPITPSVALLGALGLIVLALTLYILGRTD